MGLQKELEAKNLDGVIRELTENLFAVNAFKAFG